MDSILTFACLWYMWHSAWHWVWAIFKIYFALIYTGSPKYEFLKLWIENTSHIHPIPFSIPSHLPFTDFKKTRIIGKQVKFMCTLDELTDLWHNDYTAKKIVNLWIMRACLIVTDVTLSDTQCSSLHCVTNCCDDIIDALQPLLWHNLSLVLAQHSILNFAFWHNWCHICSNGTLSCFILCHFRILLCHIRMLCTLCSPSLQKNQFVQKLISEETFFSVQWGSTILQIRLNQDFCLIHPVWIRRLHMLARNICEGGQILFANLKKIVEIRTES